ncbi:unnamed protein product [Phytophthora fragariaefolia]|uniref:Unnamed protein product n=1 Tax=Phytophthora fragariaefolia TaxID=1490495 RepID=A0A9W6XSV1_9STRA|nr:unnamed protein product [Phytophthora fragariaefolia]
MELFYTKVHDASPTGNAEEDADVPTLFRCKCGKMRAQRLKNGYTNLVQHVQVKHADWVAAAVREARPSSVPAAANSAKSESMLKRNGKAKSKAGETKKAAVDSRDSMSDWSEGEEEEEQDVVTDASAAQPKPAVKKRAGYLSWDDYFMSVAFLSAMRSKGGKIRRRKWGRGNADAWLHVRNLEGADDFRYFLSIVNPERKIVGIGYNGFPNGCGDDDLPWARDSETNSPLDTKYPVRLFVVSPSGLTRLSVHGWIQYVCHAEMNAILNKNSTDVKGCTV